MLNDELFPPEVEFILNEDAWNNPAYNLRQVRIEIDGDLFAVINCSKDSTSEWADPSFVILRATVPMRELNQVKDIVLRSQTIMSLLNNKTTTKDDVQKLF